MQPKVLRQILWTAAIACLFACGSEAKNRRGGGGAGQSGDATADHDHDPSVLAKIASADLTACNQSGFVFERRRAGCSTELKLATSFTCDRAGVRGAFAPTGFQIDQALTAALGQEGNPADHGDGYVFDQCGASDSGRLFVQLVKIDGQGQLRVRELETNL